MSLPIVFRQRFRGFIGRFNEKPPQPFPGATTLRVATDLEDMDIDIRFRRALNRDDKIGMGDVLKTPFGVGSLKGSTKIEEVLAAIEKQARVKSMTEYRALLEPRVSAAFIEILAIAQFPPRNPAAVQPTDPLPQYVTPENVDDIAKECNVRFDKWLLSPAGLDDFASNLTVAGAIDNLLARMVIL
jgi:hypothetical protein